MSHCDFISSISTLQIQDEFEGEILHSTQYKSATDHIGKKVVVVGAGTSGHDISADCVEHGVGRIISSSSACFC